MKEYKPKIRKNGIGLPGYKEGWVQIEKRGEGIAVCNRFFKGCLNTHKG